MDKTKLPAPLCEMGYTADQVKEMFGVFLPKFQKFMIGQTVAGCPCKAYDHETKSYKPTSCKHPADPIQTIYYTGDVVRFIRGLPVID